MNRVVAQTSRDVLFIRWITTSRDVRKSGCADVSRRRKKDKSALPLARLIIPRRDSGVAPVSTVVKTIYNAAYLSMLRLPGIIKLVEIASIAHNCHGVCILTFAQLVTPRGSSGAAALPMTALSTIYDL